MTEAQRDATTPTLGDCVVNSDTDKYNYYDGANWVPMGFGTGSFENILTDGGFDTAAASGENGLTCGTGNTCAQVTTASDYINGTGALEVTMGGSNPVDVSHCYDNSTTTSWVNKAAMVRAQIKSTITDLEFCYHNNTTDESCIATDESKPNYFEYARQGFVDSGEKICWRIKSTANPSAGAKIYVDAGYAGEVNNRQDIGTETDWETWTPTGTWTTNTTYTGRKRIVGDSAEYQVTVTLTGQPDDTTLGINLPTNEVIDTSKLTAPDFMHLGTAVYYDNDGLNNGRLWGTIAYVSTTRLSANFFDDASGSSHYLSSATRTFPVTAGASDRITIIAKVPIVGWSATSEHTISPMDNVPLVKYSNANQTINSGSTDVLNFATKKFDVNGLVTTGAGWNYLARKTTKYRVNAKCVSNNMSASAVGNSALLMAFVNGSLVGIIDETFASTTSSVKYNLGGHVDIDVNYGQTIDVRLENSLGASWATINTDDRCFVEISDTQKDPIGAFPEPPRCALTVTGTGWTTASAFGLPYQTREGLWRLRFNIEGTVSSSVRTSYSATISGVTFLLGTNQSASGDGSGLTDAPKISTGSNNGNINFSHSSNTTDAYRASGDVDLASKPTISGCTF
jgi:hypothetical protein